VNGCSFNVGHKLFANHCSTWNVYPLSSLFSNKQLVYLYMLVQQQNTSLFCVFDSRSLAP